MEGRIFFAKGSKELRTHYLHIEVYNGHLWENHINFREYLIRHKELIKEYSNFKKGLASKYEKDRSEYTNEKNHFISSILRKAKEYKESL